MRGQDDRRRRHLVHVPDLEADDAVLDLVDDPDSVSPAELRRPLEQLDQTEPRRRRGDTGQPRSKPTRTSSGSSGASVGTGRPAGRRRRAAGVARSSIAPPSDERPQRLSSIEYGGVSVPPLTGMPCSRA